MKSDEVIIDEEYERLFNNELIYFEEIHIWRRLNKIFLTLSFVGIVFFFVGFFLMSEPSQSTMEGVNTSYDFLISDPIKLGLFGGGMMLFISGYIVMSIAGMKTKKISKEIGLNIEERMFLRLFETKESIQDYLKESKLKRKIYFKKLAIKSAKEVVDDLERWKVGNIGLIIKSVGGTIESIKGDFKRLLYSKIVNGDSEELRSLLNPLEVFCYYLASPSQEKLNELNVLITELPFKDYSDISTKNGIIGYFEGKPTLSRLFFSFTITIFVLVVLWNLEKSWAAVIAVGVACFWGSFSGFDKIFKLKEK